MLVLRWKAVMLCIGALCLGLSLLSYGVEEVDIDVDLVVSESISMTIKQDDGSYEDEFGAANTAGIIGKLEIDHNNVTGLGLAVRAESDGVAAEDAGGADAKNLNFNSANVTSFEVPYTIRCDATDNEGNNTYSDYVSDVSYQIDDGEGGDYCLETDDLEEVTQDLEVTATLTLPNLLKLLYHSSGYRTESITFILSDLE